MELTLIDKALREASKRLPIKSDKQLNKILEFAADDLAEAYRIGAEEAQNAIIERLHVLKAKEAGVA